MVKGRSTTAKTISYTSTVFCLLAAVAATGFAADAPRSGDAPYLIGGPLAGLELPLFQGQHGEAPGHPGCIPELMETEGNPRNRAFAPQGLAPEVELYSGAEEHWRGYWFKYCPQRSFFDRQSQVKNFVAPDIPGATRANVEQYAAPVYWVPRHGSAVDTGRKRKPVPVIRMRVGAPDLELNFGELDRGVYAIRVIAAVPTADLRVFRKAAFLRCSVNDGSTPLTTGGNNGETTLYKRRIGYCDEFYSAAEFYFHAPEKRAYTASISLGKGSEVELLVHNISLDDVLAGAVRKPVKTRATAPRPGTVKPLTLAQQERLARDAAIWNFLPPVNHQGCGIKWKQAMYRAHLPKEVSFGVADKTSEELQKEIGLWTSPPYLSDDPATWGLFLVHPKLKLSYTLDDMRAYRPLPDPFPYKDDGTGLSFVDAKDPGKGRVLAEIAREVDRRIEKSTRLINRWTDAWQTGGNSDAAHDAAMLLARYAYRFPTIETGSWIEELLRTPSSYGRHSHDRQRTCTARFLPHYQEYAKTPADYDRLFSYIQGNEQLAGSIGRFVPWVRTSADVIELIDTYLVQITAKRIMRYHYYTGSTKIADIAAVLGTNDVTEPWWDWLFGRTFTYPMPPAGLQDLMISSSDRQGTQFIGSTYYAQGQGARIAAESLQTFKDRGELPARYDLTDPALYPKVLAHCYWQIGITVGGEDFPRIGDVGGPDKYPGFTVNSKAMLAAAVNGWKWSGDPVCAWILKNRDARRGFSEPDWAEIEAAAAKQPRAPWLDLNSRQVYNWIGVLEAGTESDSHLDRRAAYLRTGLGVGHAHNDTLDLQYIMRGLPMTIDGGQRPAYSMPADQRTRVHNVVEVDGQDRSMHAWVSTISDGDGARYLRATAEPTGNLTLYQRAIALVDTDTEPETSYVVDVFRVSGGNAHTYCFHGPVSDEITSNAKLADVPFPAKGAAPSADQQFLAMFKDAPRNPGAYVKVKEPLKNRRLAGPAPDVLRTTWRYTREGRFGNEQNMLGTNARKYMGNDYDETAPRKYTRLHLLDTAGARVYRGDTLAHQFNYRITHQMVRREADGEELDSTWLAVHEPYADTPYIAEITRLAIPDNDTDARKAAAARVTLAAGRTDLLFSDGYPEKTRDVAGAKVAGEFAFISRDKAGLRIASLTGGTLLQTGDVTITAEQREYAGTITKADYLKKEITIDALWPQACSGSVFEIRAPGRTTSYTAVAAKKSWKGARITLHRGADYYRSQVTSVDAATGTVTTAVKHPLGARPGLDKGFTASNDDRTKFWRTNMIDGQTFRLTGAPVTKADFGKAGALRLWEYGAGDTVRLTTFAHLRRLDAGDQGGKLRWELTANVPVTVTLAGRKPRKVTAKDLARNGGKVIIQGE
jgi:hypothetical protein